MRVLMAPALMNVIVWKRSTEQCVRLTTVGWLVDHVSPNVCEVLIKAGAVCASCFLLIFIWSIIRTPIVNILWKGIYEASTDHSFCKERRAETKSNLWAIVRWRVGAGAYLFLISVCPALSETSGQHSHQTRKRHSRDKLIICIFPSGPFANNRRGAVTKIRMYRRSSLFDRNQNGGRCAK